MTETLGSNVVELRPGRGVGAPLPDILEATITARSLRHAREQRQQAAVERRLVRSIEIELPELAAAYEILAAARDAVAAAVEAENFG